MIVFHRIRQVYIDQFLCYWIASLIRKVFTVERITIHIIYYSKMLEKCTTIVNEEDVAKAYNSLLQNHHQDPEPTLLNRSQKKSFVQEVEAKHEAKLGYIFPISHHYQQTLQQLDLYQNLYLYHSQKSSSS